MQFDNSLRPQCSANSGFWNVERAGDEVLKSGVLQKSVHGRWMSACHVGLGVDGDGGK